MLHRERPTWRLVRPMTDPAIEAALRLLPDHITWRQARLALAAAYEAEADILEHSDPLGALWYEPQLVARLRLRAAALRGSGGA